MGRRRARRRSPSGPSWRSAASSASWPAISSSAGTWARSRAFVQVLLEMSSCRAKGLRAFCRLREGVLQLTRKKTAAGGIVGLDIEAGSIAAAEIGSNGSAQVSAAAIEPLSPGAFRDGEVADPDRLGEGLKSLFGRHKLSKSVRLGIANQRVVVRTLRLPAIEDPKEMDAAVRFQAQEQMPMPLHPALPEPQG